MFWVSAPCRLFGCKPVFCRNKLSPCSSMKTTVCPHIALRTPNTVSVLVFHLLNHRFWCLRTIRFEVLTSYCHLREYAYENTENRPEIWMWHIVRCAGAVVPRGGVGSKCLFLVLDPHPSVVESEPLQGRGSCWHQKVGLTLTLLLTGTVCNVQRVTYSIPRVGVFTEIDHTGR